MNEPWFGAKRYGFGLSPTSPNGWIATGVYAGVMIAVAPVVWWLHAPQWLTYPVMIALTAGFVTLALSRSDGRPLRWHWGGR